MHEFGLCEGIIDAVERRADGRRVAGVRVRVGTLHRVVEAALTQAFELVSAGTVADGAAIELVVVPVRAGCEACGHETESADPVAVCAGCGSTEVEMLTGDELLLESIRLVADLSVSTERVD
ncbi:hydrogenase maturation nickel metallochaperone HypA [soil metagenome]